VVQLLRHFKQCPGQRQQRVAVAPDDSGETHHFNDA
jgi:hypothetical protein